MESKKPPKETDQKPSSSHKEPMDSDQKPTGSEKNLSDNSEKSFAESVKKRKRFSRKPTLEIKPTVKEHPMSSESESNDEKEAKADKLAAGSEKNQKKTIKEKVGSDKKLKLSPTEKESTNSFKEPLNSDKELSDSGKKTPSSEKILKALNDQPTSSDEKSKNSEKTSSDSSKKRKTPWTQEKIDLNEEPQILQHMAMVSNSLTRLLDTASSIIVKKNYFTGRRSTYIPDFFFLFFFISLFLGSAIIDRMFTLMIFFYKKDLYLGVLYFICAMNPLIYFLLFDETKNAFLERYNLNQCFNVVFRLIIVFFGLDSVFIGRNILNNMRQEVIFWKELREKYGSTDFHLFHIPDAKHCDIKIYCFVCTVTKSVPQLFLASFYLLKSETQGVIVLFAFKVMMMNMLIFSLTMAITFPIRKSPKVFRTCTSALLNGFTKFLATMCSCGLTLLVFAILFPHIGVKALFLHLAWFLGALIPSFYMLNTLPHLFPNKVYLITFAVIFSVVFTFIYIHPFQRRGKFFYYYFHFIGILTEIAALYLLTDINNDEIMVYMGLKALVIGLMGGCLLNNVLHKVDRYKAEKKNFFEPLIL